ASASLSLLVDSPSTEARTSSGTVVSKKSESNGGTRLEVAGPAGQFRLTWQNANRDAASIASVLNAVGAIRVAIDGRGVRSDARLTVSSFGGGFDQFRVRLPRDAKLIPNAGAVGSQDSKYRVVEEPKASATRQDAANTSPMVLVEWKEKQHGPVVVDLSTEQSSSPGAAG